MLTRNKALQMPPAPTFDYFDGRWRFPRIVLARPRESLRMSGAALRRWSCSSNPGPAVGLAGGGRLPELLSHGGVGDSAWSARATRIRTSGFLACTFRAGQPERLTSVVVSAWKADVRCGQPGKLTFRVVSCCFITTRPRWIRSSGGSRPYRVSFGKFRVTDAWLIPISVPRHIDCLSSGTAWRRTEDKL